MRKNSHNLNYTKDSLVSRCRCTCEPGCLLLLTEAHNAKLALGSSRLSVNPVQHFTTRECWL